MTKAFDGETQPPNTGQLSEKEQLERRLERFAQDLNAPSATPATLPAEPSLASVPTTQEATEVAQPDKLSDLYNQFFKQRNKRTWEALLKEAGYAFRRVSLNVPNPLAGEPEEEAGVYRLDEEPEGTFYLLHKYSSNRLLIVPSPWLQFVTRGMQKQIERLYPTRQLGTGTIDQLQTATIMEPVGDGKRWTIREQGQLTFVQRQPTAPPIATPPPLPTAVSPSVAPEPAPAQPATQAMKSTPSSTRTASIPNEPSLSTGDAPSSQPEDDTPASELPQELEDWFTSQETQRDPSVLPLAQDVTPAMPSEPTPEPAQAVEPIPAAAAETVAQRPLPEAVKRLFDQQLTTHSEIATFQQVLAHPDFEGQTIESLDWEVDPQQTLANLRELVEIRKEMGDESMTELLWKAYKELTSERDKIQTKFEDQASIAFDSAQSAEKKAAARMEVEELMAELFEINGKLIKLNDVAVSYGTSLEELMDTNA